MIGSRSTLRVARGYRQGLKVKEPGKAELSKAVIMGSSGKYVPFFWLYGD